MRSSVRHHFPRLSKRAASTITFLGHDPSLVCNDLAAKPEVALFYTSLYIIFVFVLLTYSRPSHLTLSPLRIGDLEWEQYIFSLLRYVCVCVCSGFSFSFFFLYLYIHGVVVQCNFDMT